MRCPVCGSELIVWFDDVHSCVCHRLQFRVELNCWDFHYGYGRSMRIEGDQFFLIRVKCLGGYGKPVPLNDMEDWRFDRSSTVSLLINQSLVSEIMAL